MIIIKIGGSVVDKISDLIPKLQRLMGNNQVILVHGGAGKVTNILSEQLGVLQRWVTHPSGMRSRYTDEETIEVFLMAVCQANKQVVAELSKHGIRAVGLTGLDGDLVKARRKSKIRILEGGEEKEVEGDYTGMLRAANTDLLNSLLSDGYIPVIAPLAMSFDREPLNVDGDRLAAFLANKLRAKRVISVTDVPGVLDQKDAVVPEIPRSEVEQWIQRVGSGSSTGGMKRKLFAAKESNSEFLICGIENFGGGTKIK